MYLTLKLTHRRTRSTTSCPGCGVQVLERFLQTPAPHTQRQAVVCQSYTEQTHPAAATFNFARAPKYPLLLWVLIHFETSDAGHASASSPGRLFFSRSAARAYSALLRSTDLPVLLRVRRRIGADPSRVSFLSCRSASSSSDLSVNWGRCCLTSCLDYDGYVRMRWLSAAHR